MLTHSLGLVIKFNFVPVLKYYCLYLICYILFLFALEHKLLQIFIVVAF